MYFYDNNNNKYYQYINLLYILSINMSYNDILNQSIRVYKDTINIRI
jgi:hypothetical protein